MELFFLIVLIALMVIALSSGFPVAFALPGVAILSIGLAALSGYIFADNINAYFSHDGPLQWISTGVTNFRGIYWEIERDTLIAIPLFIFMGIMLEKSKVAEDLLVRMAQLFGPIPGGLGISVIFVGALLAASTGIVGATVVAMGLISLPAMLRNKYSPDLASGAICASGTLGQIIPPSVVLIILVDQLSNAVDQAQTLRITEYKENTGQFSMPAEFNVTSASAGEMFLGAFIPGLILVALYMTYILVYAIIKPKSAPPVHYNGKYNTQFAIQVALSLIPPLFLIFLVLGSIITGIATVNQAGAIGAIGALIMASYRLVKPSLYAFMPAIIALASITAIFALASIFNLNIKNIHSQTDMFGIFLAIIAVITLLAAIAWSAWRTFKINNTLQHVMIETAKTTSLVFIILVGAAMLTAAFRGFGGEELVRNFLTSLPGGFWTQFIVVMLVIFILGFFLDFIEIAVVVVPIVAPILLANTSANITAVWLGVMVGLNIQTSFLTPPFGFALFYLRGVAKNAVKTISIYRGVIAFIALQIIALIVVGAYPPFVNYLPNRAYLTSENAPPPRNPRLQKCMEKSLFATYQTNQNSMITQAQNLLSLPTHSMPPNTQKIFTQSLENIPRIFELAQQVKQAENNRVKFIPQYQPLQQQVKSITRQIKNIDKKITKAEKQKRHLIRENRVSPNKISNITFHIENLKTQQQHKKNQIPEAWKNIRSTYSSLIANENNARNLYRKTSDTIYQNLTQLHAIIAQAPQFAEALPKIITAHNDFPNLSKDANIQQLKQLEKSIASLTGAKDTKAKITKARRSLKKDKTALAHQQLNNAIVIAQQSIAWQNATQNAIGTQLQNYLQSIKFTIGLRLQDKIPKNIAKDIASCKSHHQNISLYF